MCRWVYIDWIRSSNQTQPRKGNNRQVIERIKRRVTHSSSSLEKKKTPELISE